MLNYDTPPLLFFVKKSKKLQHVIDVERKLLGLLGDLQIEISFGDWKPTLVDYRSFHCPGSNQKISHLVYFAIAIFIKSNKLSIEVDPCFQNWEFTKRIRQGKIPPLPKRDQLIAAIVGQSLAKG